MTIKKRKRNCLKTNHKQKDLSQIQYLPLRWNTEWMLKHMFGTVTRSINEEENLEPHTGQKSWILLNFQGH